MSIIKQKGKWWLFKIKEVSKPDLFLLKLVIHNFIRVFRNCVTEIIPRNLNRIMPAEEMQVYMQSLFNIILLHFLVMDLKRIYFKSHFIKFELMKKDLTNWQGREEWYLE